MLTFSDSQDFSHLRLGLCLLPKPLHEYACTRSLKLPQFWGGDNYFEKVPRYSPYLRQVINPFFSRSLASLCPLAQNTPRGELSFLITGKVKTGECFRAGPHAAGPWHVWHRHLGRAQSLTHPHSHWMCPSMWLPIFWRLRTDLFVPGWGTGHRSGGCCERKPEIEGGGVGVNAWMCWVYIPGTWDGLQWSGEYLPDQRSGTLNRK